MSVENDLEPQHPSGPHDLGEGRKGPGPAPAEPEQPTPQPRHPQPEQPTPQPPQPAIPPTGPEEPHPQLPEQQEIFVSLVLVIVLVLTFMFSSVEMASLASQTSQQSIPVIKLGPPMSGEDIFKWYCAACHGKTGKGNGPAASELKVKPPDLTLLAKRNKGKFPTDYVTRILRNGTEPSAHGTAEMPTWGPLFTELNAKGRVTVEIEEIVHYLASMQEK